MIVKVLIPMGADVAGTQEVDVDIPIPPGGGSVAQGIYTGDGANGRVIATGLVGAIQALFLFRGGLAVRKLAAADPGNNFRTFDVGNPVNGITFAVSDFVVDGIFAANENGTEYNWVAWS